MQDGQELLIKRVDATTLVVDEAGQEKRFLVLGRMSPCPHDALKAGRVLTVRIPTDPSGHCRSRGRAWEAQPCGFVFVLIRDFWR